MQPIRRLFLICLPLLAALPAAASELTLEARLIWAVNEAQSPTYQSAPPDLSNKLHAIYKWNNYYDITNQIHSIPINESRDFKMSDKCVLKIKNLGNSRVEVSCIGQGKEVSKGSHTVSDTQWVVLAGNARNGTAWFIGLRPVDSALAKQN